MAKQYVKVRGVGGGHMSIKKPTIPKLAFLKRVTNGKHKA